MQELASNSAMRTLILIILALVAYGDDFKQTVEKSELPGFVDVITTVNGKEEVRYSINTKTISMVRTNMFYGQRVTMVYTLMPENTKEERAFFIEDKNQSNESVVKILKNALKDKP